MKAGIHLFHKPVGVTSFSIVREQQPSAEGLSLCHGGTLDPFADGLLLLLAGEATRLMDLLHELPKTYVAKVAFGRETDTGDAGGVTTFEGDASALDEAKLRAAFKPFLGWTEQVPPATSAKKIDGEPAYKKAHRGEEVLLPPSRVYLHSLWPSELQLPQTTTLTLVCRGGFYVRALARDLGRALGCGAHLTGLTRTAIGPFSDPGPAGEPSRFSGRALFTWYPTREVDDRELTRLRRRESIPLGELSPPTWAPPQGFPLEPRVRVVQARKFQGIAREVAGVLVPHVVLPRGI